jgi:hypothetical protein
MHYPRKDMMDITTYLPDDVGEWAKTNDINLSATLRAAVIEERERREELAAAQDGMVQQLVDTSDRYSDSAERLRFTGKEIAGGFGIAVYLTAAGQVLMVEEDGYETFADREAFSEWIYDAFRNNLGQDSEQALTEAAAELGLPRVTDIA